MSTPSRTPSRSASRSDASAKNELRAVKKTELSIVPTDNNALTFSSAKDAQGKWSTKVESGITVIRRFNEKDGQTYTNDTVRVGEKYVPVVGMKDSEFTPVEGKKYQIGIAKRLAPRLTAPKDSVNQETGEVKEGQRKLILVVPKAGDREKTVILMSGPGNEIKSRNEAQIIEADLNKSGSSVTALVALPAEKSASQEYDPEVFFRYVAANPKEGQQKTSITQVIKGENGQINMYGIRHEAVRKAEQPPF